MRTAQVLFAALLTASTFPQTAPAPKEVEDVYPDARELYFDLHRNPELSSHETQTAAKLAGRLRTVGYDVSEHVGGTGIVALVKNAPGPTVMVRTGLDALPVEERTGLPYASKVHTNDDSGRDVAVMHACGHDLHMASLIATATIMTRSKDTWHGTLMVIGQPAEETLSGAKKMIENGFLTPFPNPELPPAFHHSTLLPAAKVGVGPGYP